ncbi:MAG: NAD(P)/FAD-dependent oxidoreductase, partial [Actinomycetota bacterium]
TLQSGIDLRMALDEELPERAVVVGGGYIGLEAAEALVERGLETSLVEALDQPMSTLEAGMAALITTELSGAGVKVHLEEPVLAFERRGERVSAVVTTERTIETDLVVLGLGTAPNVELARKAGLEIGESGAIFVDDRMSTRSEGIWAAGDCAEQVHRVTGKPVNLHLGTIANKMGRIAGINIAGGRVSFRGCSEPRSPRCFR